MREVLREIRSLNDNTMGTSKWRNSSLDWFANGRRPIRGRRLRGVTLGANQSEVVDFMQNSRPQEIRRTVARWTTTFGGTRDNSIAIERHFLYGSTSVVVHRPAFLNRGPPPKGAMTLSSAIHEPFGSARSPFRRF